MADIRVMFATPTFDYQCAVEYTSSLMATSMTLLAKGIEPRAKFLGGLCFIDIARNDLVKHFLATDSTHLFFIDADVGWDYTVVERFLHYKQSITAGLVPKKWDKESAKIQPPFHDNAMTGVMEDGLLESLEVPTAFMCIKRHVFQILDEAYPHYKEYHTMERGIPYFQTGYVKDPESGKVTFMGEDIFFCRQWCRLGEKLWIDPNVNFSHRGSSAWKGNHIEHCLDVGKLTRIEDNDSDECQSTAA